MYAQAGSSNDQAEIRDSDDECRPKIVPLKHVLTGPIRLLAEYGCTPHARCVPGDGPCGLSFYIGTIPFQETRLRNFHPYSIKFYTLI